LICPANHCMKDGMEYESAGIRTDKDEMTEAEIVSVQDQLAGRNGA